MFHKAEDIEGRVRELVYRLLHDPEALRRQVLAQLELDRAGLGRAEQEVGFLLEEVAEADRERDGCLMLAARGRISGDELGRYLAESERRKEGARRKLAGLRDRRERLHKLDELARTADEHLANLPHIIDRRPPVRKHDTVPPGAGLDGGLPIYELNPGRIRERTPQELERLNTGCDRERA
jgi:hypothetical protein